MKKTEEEIYKTINDFQGFMLTKMNYEFAKTLIRLIENDSELKKLGNYILNHTN